MDELQAVSDAWLGTNSDREKGLSLNCFYLEYRAEFDCAMPKKRGVIVAFANLQRSGDQNELSTDLMH